FSDLAGTMSNKPVQLTQGQIDVRGDQRMIHISGPVRAGTSNLNISWNEYLNRRGRASSEYQIGGDFDANDLVRPGYGLAAYTSGRLGVTISGQGRGFDVDHANVQIDLRNAAVDSPWPFWTKRAGQTPS